jgi:hypothetical protein
MNAFGTFQRRASRMSHLVAVVAVAALAVAMTAPGAVAPGSQKCGICGKNLITNPGAESGRGVIAVGAFGAVPGWTLVDGQFGAASYTFRNGWFSAKTKGPAKRGRNYFFGGTTEAAVRAQASVGTQTIALPASAAGRKATLSAWLGNYGNNRAQVRAEFADAVGTVLSRIKVGPAVTIGGADMGLRSRTGTVPPNASKVTVVISFGGTTAAYKLAGADNLSLVLA